MVLVENKCKCMATYFYPIFSNVCVVLKEKSNSLEILSVVELKSILEMINFFPLFSDFDNVWASTKIFLFTLFKEM